MKKITYSILVAISIFSVSEAQQLSFALEPFHQIKTKGQSNVTLVRSDQAEIVGNSDLSEALFSVQDGVLTIDTKNNTNNKINLNVTVYFQKLESIAASGTSRIVSKSTIIGDNLTINASGASRIEIPMIVTNLETNLSGVANANLSGEATTHTLNCSGTASLRGNKLFANTTQLSTSGSSSVALNTVNLSGNASGVSHVNTQGTQNNELEISGMSSISVNGGTLQNRQINEGKKQFRRLNAKIDEFGNRIFIQDSNANVATNITEDGEDIPIEEEEESPLDVEERKHIKKEIIYTDKAIELNDQKQKADDQNNHSGKTQSKRKSHSPYKAHWSGFELGIQGYGTEPFSTNLPNGYDDMELRPGQSISFAWNIFQYSFGFIEKPSVKLGLVTGLGFVWDQFSFADPSVIPTWQDGVFAMTRYTGSEQRQYTRSRIHEVWFRVPLLMELQLRSPSRHSMMSLAAGIVGGIRCSAYLEQAYTLELPNGEKHRRDLKSRNDIALNALAANAEVRLGFSHFNFFVNYALTPLFNEKANPDLTRFSAGIALSFRG
ncbi:hypothetical protein FACS1894201_01630 [Bacteroidia bacterium]|nr:hypothetical protein FACS1894201_01630 [Bacteroidia bacterium]